MGLKVLQVTGEIEDFKPSRIKNKIIAETGLSEDEAERIKNSVVSLIHKRYKEEVDTSTIRSLINNQLVKRGFIEEEDLSKKLGMSVSDITNLIENGNHDNANIMYSPEMVAKYIYDANMKSYALLSLPKELRQAHTEGYLHIHDLEYFNLRPNCLSGRNNIIIKNEYGNVFYVTIEDFVTNYFGKEKYYVPSLNIQTNNIEWKEIENAYYSGVEEVFEITFNKGYSIECTNDHKFIKSHSNKPCKDYNIKVKDFNKYSDLRLCNITNIPYDNVSEELYLKSALFGFFLGDGYQQNHNIRFVFAKQDKADYLKYLLDNLNIDYTFSEKEDNQYKDGISYNFYIKEQIYPKTSKSELIHKFKDKLNLKGVLEGFINSDGCVRRDYNNVIRLNFTSTNKDIFDLYQLALLTSGIRGSISVLHPKKEQHSMAYISSSFGENLLFCLKSMRLRKHFEDHVIKANSSMKKYKEISEVTPKQIKSNGFKSVYNLTIKDNHNYMAGINGFVLTQNCFNHDIRFYGRNGLKIDGKGVMGAVANPAKSLKVILNHMLQAMMAGAMVLSGGQSFSHFNVFLAPYCKGMSYSEIKQEIQGFIYNCNMSLIGRGGQSIFSSINLEFDIPDFLKDVPAVAPSGVYQGVYGDYKEESDLVFKAVCEVLKEKDAIGRYFTFPNTLFVIREHTLDKYDWKVQLVHELLSENPTIYFMNCVNENRITMGALTIDTPVMTNKGLKYPNELKIGDTVMTYNPDGTKDWNKLYNVIEKPAPNKVFKFTCENGYSFKVTENHKLPTKDGIKLSEDIKIEDELYNYVDKKEDYKLLKEYEFIGIFLADGFIRHKPKHQRNGNNIEFHFKKEWKIKKVCSICDELGYNYDIKERKDGTTCIYVREKELRDKLVKLYDDKRNCKRFPKSIWDNKDKIYSVIMGLNFDSNISDNHNYYVWSCSDKPLVEDVCFALSYLGYQTKIDVDIRKNWRPNYKISYGSNYTPKTTTIVKSIEVVDNTEPVYDLSVENNANYVCGLGGIHSENCRTTLSNDWTGDWEKDLMNTGNFHYTTINLPLLALESENINDFYDKLGYYMDISRLILLERKRNIEHVFDLGMSDFLLQKDKETGEPLYDIKRCSFSIGLCGLNECLKQITGKGVKDDSIDGEKIVSFMTKKINEYKQKDNLRWSLFFSPAESTAHRFAEINKKKYPKDAIVNGTKGSYYLTNSSHINVDDNATLVEHIKNANIFHKYAKAGNILHLWLGEPFPDPKSLYSLNKKIAETETKFWAYTNDYTYCRNCQHNIQLPLSKCPNCGSKDVVVMSRITGYYQPVLGYNKGKKQEFKDRYRHRLNK